MNVLLVNPQVPDTFWSLKNALQFVSKKAILASDGSADHRLDASQGLARPAGGYGRICPCGTGTFDGRTWSL